MAFLDDLDRKVTSLGQGVKQKSKEVTDSVKLNSALKSLGNQKKEEYEKLGEAYFRLCCEEKEKTAPELEEFITHLKGLISQEKELQEQIQKIKNVVYCPNCNAELPGESKFCNVCGTEIKLVRKEPRGKVCKNCGARLEDDQRFCTECGAKIESTGGTDGAEEERVHRCTKCGKPLADDERFCTECGTPSGF